MEFGDRQLTYRELHERAARLARRLAARGVGPGSTVALALLPSPEAVIAVFAVLRAGAAWLPLDLEYPRERLAFILRDSGADLILADSAQDAALPQLGLPIVSLAEQEAIALAGEAAGGDAQDTADIEGTDQPVPEVGPADLAYLIYTSGSTGTPKGVMLTHGGLANLAEAELQVFGVRPEDRVLQFASWSFDASVFELAMALYNGATLVLPATREVRFGPELAEFLRQTRVSIATLPPSVLSMLPDADFPALHTLISAGDALSEELADRFAPGRRLVNAYGPTEITVWASYAEVTAGGGKPLIGRAIPGAELLVLDENQQPVTPGAAGELAVGGAGLARGYAGRPDLTEERFIADPRAGGVTGGRVYRTGDRVRMLPNGELEFLGRIDEQIKLRGFRIEPGEVAEVLRGHPLVRDAFVMLRPFAGEDRLVAYAVAPDEAAEQLRVHAAERLPGYMVPLVTPVDRLPLTPAGKVDRAALPEPRVGAQDDGAAAYAGRSPLEQRTAELFERLLGVTGVGPDDDFFALGGHSLLAGRLLAQISSELGGRLPMAEFYRLRTVSSIAAYLAGEPDATAEPASHPEPRGERREPIPLSFQQERIWYLETLSPDNVAYLASAAIRLHGPLDVDVLRGALTGIVDNHEIFRTGFVATDDGTAVQQPLPPGSVAVALTVVDLSEFAPAEREERQRQRIEQQIGQSFDRSRPPLVRWTLFRHGPREHVLLHVEHHLVHDGWSFAVFLNEFEAQYTARAAGRTPPAAPPLQFADYALWQRERMRGEVLDRCLGYWTRLLDGAPPALDLPTDRPRPKFQSFDGAAIRFDLPAPLSRSLRGYAREHGVTLYAAMMAAFAALLHRYTGETDLVIGTGAANRPSAAAEAVIGMFVNTLPLRLRLERATPYEALTRQVLDLWAAAADQADVPLDRLVAAVNPPRDTSRNPLFQVMFSFHDSAVPDLEFAGLRGEIHEQHNGSAKTDLNIVVIPRAEQRAGRGSREGDDRITVIWEYSTALFDEATMRRMIEHYTTLATAALAAPETAVGELGLLSAAEERHAVADHNQTASPFPDKRLHELVAEQVRLSPHATAVVHGLDSISYAELDARAGRLAGLLRERGAGPDVPVGVLLGRGIDLVVATLAVVKAGSAYVPLNPDYPAHRLAVLAEGAELGLVVTDADAWERVRHEPELGRLDAIRLDADAALFADRTPTPPAVPGTPRDLAYIVYTSGSTGVPKGVLVEHRSVVRLVCDVNYVELGPRERIGQAADPSFDAFTFELWASLVHGGSLHILDMKALLRPGGLREELRRHEVTTLFLTTALFNEVMRTDPDAFAGLKNLATGGEKADLESFRRLVRSASAPERLLHVYGPTEVTTFATWHLCQDVPDDALDVPIGLPVSNTTAYVLDPGGRPVPIGVPGELHLGGPGVARGYAGSPELTAERFIRDPYSDDPDARLYRTGDIVRRGPDGLLTHRGRMDKQVKIRGFRVEPGEVEAVLAGHPGVGQTAVIVEERGTERRLVGYATPAHADDPPSVAELRRHLGERLPVYLVPAALVVLDSLPTTPRGKLDPSRLPAPDEDAAATAEQYVPPRTETEREVAELCARLLRVTRIGVDDDFFERGGHSLLAARLVADAGHRFGTEVTLAGFLELPTVAALAAAIDSGPAAASAPIRPAARRRAAGLLERLDELSAAEVERALRDLGAELDSASVAPGPDTPRNGDEPRKDEG